MKLSYVPNVFEVLIYIQFGFVLCLVLYFILCSPYTRIPISWSKKHISLYLLFPYTATPNAILASLPSPARPVYPVKARSSSGVASSA